MRYDRPVTPKYFALFESLVGDAVGDADEDMPPDADESQDGVALSFENGVESPPSNRQQPQATPTSPHQQPEKLIDREDEVLEDNTLDGLGLDLGPVRGPAPRPSLASIDGREVDLLLSGPPTESVAPPAEHGGGVQANDASQLAGGKKRKGLQEDGKDASGDPSAPTPPRKSPRFDIPEGSPPDSASAEKRESTTGEGAPVVASEAAPLAITAETLLQMKYSELQALAKVGALLARFSVASPLTCCLRNTAFALTRARINWSSSC